MEYEELKSWLETISLISNQKAVEALERGISEAHDGQFYSFKEVFKEEQ